MCKIVLDLLNRDSSLDTKCLPANFNLPPQEETIKEALRLCLQKDDQKDQATLSGISNKQEFYKALSYICDPKNLLAQSHIVNELDEKAYFSKILERGIKLLYSEGQFKELDNVFNSWSKLPAENLEFSSFPATASESACEFLKTKLSVDPEKKEVENLLIKLVIISAELGRPYSASHLQHITSYESEAALVQIVCNKENNFSIEARMYALSTLDVNNNSRFITHQSRTQLSRACNKLLTSKENIKNPSLSNACKINNKLCVINPEVIEEVLKNKNTNFYVKDELIKSFDKTDIQINAITLKNIVLDLDEDRLLRFSALSKLSRYYPKQIWDILSLVVQNEKDSESRYLLKEYFKQTLKTEKGISFICKQLEKPENNTQKKDIIFIEELVLTAGTGIVETENCKNFRTIAYHALKILLGKKKELSAEIAKDLLSIISHIKDEVENCEDIIFDSLKHPEIGNKNTVELLRQLFFTGTKISPEFITKNKLANEESSEELKELLGLIRISNSKDISTQEQNLLLNILEDKSFFEATFEDTEVINKQTKYLFAYILANKHKIKDIPELNVKQLEVLSFRAQFYHNIDFFLLQNTEISSLALFNMQDSSLARQELGKRLNTGLLKQDFINRMIKLEIHLPDSDLRKKVSKYIKNLQEIYQTEEISFSRFSPTALNRILEKKSHQYTDNNLTCIIVAAPVDADWNNALYDCEGQINKLIEKGYEIEYLEFTDIPTTIKRLNQLKQKKSNGFDSLIVMGHGDVYSIRTQNETKKSSTLNIFNAGMLKQLANSNLLSHDAVVILSSCSTGFGERTSVNIGRAIRFVLGKDIKLIAPTQPTSIYTYKFDNNSKIEDIFYNNNVKATKFTTTSFSKNIIGKMFRTSYFYFSRIINFFEN